MHAHRLQITIPENHDGEISIHRPDDFPSGPAEVIVISNAQNASLDARPPQPMTAALEVLRSFQATPEEEKVLDDFESFQRDHPFTLNNLTEEP